ADLPARGKRVFRPPPPSLLARRRPPFHREHSVGGARRIALSLLRWSGFYSQREASGRRIACPCPRSARIARSVPLRPRSSRLSRGRRPAAFHPHGRHPEPSPARSFSAPRRFRRIREAVNLPRSERSVA